MDINILAPNLMVSGTALTDSTRTTNIGGATVDFSHSSLNSDLTSEITSTSGQSGCLSEFQLLRLIGRGKYSQVFAATHLPTGTQVALKKVAIFDMSDPQARSDCLKEVKILQNLEHPNIVKCFNSFIQDNELIIVLEWAEAGDLGRLLKERADQNNAFPPDQVWGLFMQIASAIKHMHDRRMMHRDLKPGNVFVTAAGTLKLGDLGLSRYFSSRTLQALTTVGTPYYMSPECIRGQPYDFSSDIWSLGCLLYELIALRNPFYKENQSLYALGKTITTCAYAPLPDTVPPQLRNLVTAMLHPQPQARPSATELMQVLVAGPRSALLLHSDASTPWAARLAAAASPAAHQQQHQRPQQQQQHPQQPRLEEEEEECSSTCRMES